MVAPAAEEPSVKDRWLGKRRSQKGDFLSGWRFKLKKSRSYWWMSCWAFVWSPTKQVWIWAAIYNVDLHFYTIFIFQEPAWNTFLNLPCCHHPSLNLPLLEEFVLSRITNIRDWIPFPCIALKLRLFEGSCDFLELMAAWSSRKLLRDVVLKRLVPNQLSAVRCFSSAPQSAPKIGYYSKKVRILNSFVCMYGVRHYALSCWFVLRLEDTRFFWYAAVCICGVFSVISKFNVLKDLYGMCVLFD